MSDFIWSFESKLVPIEFQKRRRNRIWAGGIWVQINGEEEWKWRWYLGEIYEEKIVEAEWAGARKEFVGGRLNKREIAG